MLREVACYRAFVLLVSFTFCKCDYFFNGIEGEKVRFAFPYPCGVLDITLQFGNRAPFYQSWDPLTLTLDQPDRFTIQHTNGSSCSLHLEIDPVKRTDGGTYILLTQDNSYIERVGLNVDFLPGKPQCKSEGKHITGNWLELHCIGSVGSMVGQIQCYQEGILMPLHSGPHETLKTLEATILVQQNHHNVFCCPTPAIEPKEKCECNDFVWDPLSKNEVNTTDPCPPATKKDPVNTAPTDNQKSEPSLSMSVATTSLQISDIPVTWYNPLTTSMTIVIIIMVIVFILILIRYRKIDSNRPKSYSKTTSKQESSDFNNADKCDNVHDSAIDLPMLTKERNEV